GDMFIEGVINTLPDDAVRVMELVSVFARAVPLPLLEQFATPYLENGSLRSVLNRLIRAFFLSYNTDDQTVSMHPIDRSYCYDKIDLDRRTQLHHAVAELYSAAFENDARVTSITELHVPLSEVYHRVRAGEFERAAALLLELDREYLSIWGNYAELADQYAQVIDALPDGEQKRAVMLGLGEALRRIGKLHDAIDWFENVIALASAAGDEQRHATALASMGWARYDTGQFRAAISHWEDALTIFREIGDRYGEGDLLGGRGWVSYLMGNYDEALNNIQQSFLIFGEIGNQLYRIGMNIGDSGIVRAAQRDYEQAIRNLRESLSIAEVTNAVNEKSYKGGYLAMTLLLNGEVEEAEAVARTAVQYDVPANRHFVAAVHGIALSRLGRTDEAVAAFRDAVRYADSILRFT
ncbi:MAG: tetratricopeptide repeat protein, partial [Chloroflexota bacterium]